MEQNSLASNASNSSGACTAAPLHRLVARNFTLLSQDELIVIWQRRNHPDVRKCMVHTEPITLEDHLRFCASLKDRPEQLMLFVQYDGQPAFVQTFHATDSSWQHIADSGSYAFDPAPCSCSVFAKALALRLIALRGIQSSQVKIKNDNELAIFTNQYYFGLTIDSRDDEYTYMKATCPESAEYYQALCDQLLAQNHTTLDLQL